MDHPMQHKQPTQATVTNFPVSAPDEHPAELQAGDGYSYLGQTSTVIRVSSRSILITHPTHPTGKTRVNKADFRQSRAIQRTDPKRQHNLKVAEARLNVPVDYSLSEEIRPGDGYEYLGQVSTVLTVCDQSISITHPTHPSGQARVNNSHLKSNRIVPRNGADRARALRWGNNHVAISRLLVEGFDIEPGDGYTYLDQVSTVLAVSFRSISITNPRNRSGTSRVGIDQIRADRIVERSNTQRAEALRSARIRLRDLKEQARHIDIEPGDGYTYLDQVSTVLEVSPRTITITHPTAKKGKIKFNKSQISQHRMQRRSLSERAEALADSLIPLGEYPYEAEPEPWDDITWALDDLEGVRAPAWPDSVPDLSPHWFALSNALEIAITHPKPIP